MKRIIAVAWIALVAWSLALSQTQSKEKTIDSVAVLPFVNVGHDQTNQYLSDEITNKLIGSLSKLPGLKVVPFSSVLQYKDLEPVDPHLAEKSTKMLDPQTVGITLKVQAVIYGRVSKSGGFLSISAELVDARDNSLIWGDQHVRKLSDLLAVQEEMAHDISKKLRPSLAIDRKVKRHSKKAKRRAHHVNPK